MKSLITIVAISTFLSSAAQVPVPANMKYRRILLLNAVAHIGNGNVIENAVIATDSNRIALVGDATVIKVDPSAYDTVIHLNGQHIYPGFILPDGQTGIEEIEAVRASRDDRETGRFNPHVRSIIAYNAESTVIPTIRCNGVLVEQVTPQGGIISGSSSIVQFDAWNWEDALLLADDGIHLNWPHSPYIGIADKKQKSEQEKKYQEQLVQIRQFFTRAAAYARQSEHKETDLRMNAMKGIFNGSRNLYIHSNRASDVAKAVNFVRDFNIPKPVLVGGADAWMLCDLLKENKIPVILRRLHTLPNREDTPVDQVYKSAAVLQKAGILFCLGYEGDMAFMGGKNLPFVAGTAVAYGLGKEQAVAAISGNAARILGMGDRLGTLEVGKEAIFFVSTGDALDMRTNNVILAIIDGRIIDTGNRQIDLYKRYRKHILGR